MAIRLLPFQRRISPEQEPIVTSIVNDVTDGLTPDAIEQLIESKRSLWHYINVETRENFKTMLGSYHDIVRQIDSGIVLEAIMLSRPDLYRVIVRNGGKEWLKTQTQEIKRAILI